MLLQLAKQKRITFTDNICSFFLLTQLEACPLCPGSLRCMGNSRGRAWQPWAGRADLFCLPAWRRKPHSGSGRWQQGGGTGWSWAGGRLEGSISACSNPGQLGTKKRKMVSDWNWGFEKVYLLQALRSVLPSYPPAKAPHLRTHGPEGRRVHCGAPCTPALVWSLGCPTAWSVHERRRPRCCQSALRDKGGWGFRGVIPNAWNSLYNLKQKLWPGPACLPPSGSSHPAGCAGRWWPTLGGSGWPSCCYLCGLAAAGRCWRFPQIGIRWTARGPGCGEEIKSCMWCLSHIGFACNKLLDLP